MDEDLKAGYLRVSHILKPLANFEHVDEEVLEAKTRTGSAVHKAIEMDFLGLCPVLDKKSEPYFESYKAWMALTGFEIVKSETRLYDESLKITGCIDGCIIDGSSTKKTIIDFKTSSIANPRYWEHQGAFYRHLAAINGLDPSDEYLFVQLSRNGKLPKIHKFKASHVIWSQCLKLYYACLSDLKC